MAENSVAAEKKEIWKMFDTLSSSYDMMNRVMTGGLDIIWRSRAANFIPKDVSVRLLDVATGTGDQLIAACKKRPAIVKAIGIDMAQEMLNIGEKKREKLLFKEKIHFQRASALDLPFAAGVFDAITLSFGVRNVTSVEKCCLEMARVLKKGGVAIILETSKPKNFILAAGHRFYMRQVMPKIGSLFTKKGDSYRYLSQSSEAFPCGEKFCTLMRENGFKEVKAYPQFGGAVTIYVGTT